MHSSITNEPDALHLTGRPAARGGRHLQIKSIRLGPCARFPFDRVIGGRSGPLTSR